MSTMSVYKFTREIQQMMFSLGDCLNPFEESACLIEAIVLDYLVKVMHMLEDACKLRENKVIGLEEMLFLFRKDKVKIMRIIHFLKFKDLKDRIKETEPEEAGVCIEEKAKPKKRLKTCYDFFSHIDPHGSLLSLLDSDVEDDLKKQRRIRLEKLTRQLTTQQYLAYCDARQTSFAPTKKMPKFNDWLFAKLPDFKYQVNQIAMELLAYLAYEAVAEVVESALLVRKDGQLKVDDPLTFYMSPISVNYEQSSNHNAKSASLTNDPPTHQSTMDPSKQPGITPSEIREAMRRMAHTNTIISFTTKSLPSFAKRHLWL